MSLKAQLAKAKSLWGAATKLKPDFDNVVTDGVYVGRITRAEMGESESSGRLQVAWAAVISAGEFKGEKVSWWSGLKTEQNFMYLQRDLVRLGKEVPPDVNDLEEVLAEIAKDKPTIRFKVKTDGEFQNIRILKKLEGAEAPEEDEAPEKASEPAPEDPEPEPEEDPTAEPEEQEAPTLDIGVRAAFDLGGKEVVGKVVKVDKDSGKASVELENGKRYGVLFDKLRPAPKTTVKKK